ncbi:hypothetical protein EYF80_032810 [Liparis tanakae]|uniref:Uncharacterized protein n=1 Tax=Liparis tanakae TaxID=230148 RepID=A0A4Z2GU96_9TELE|nr:hypothetical protein EYF80_032810 [Liparis tanakae]
MGESHRDADDDDDEEVALWVWEESLTVVWDDEPGHGGGVDASDHPEHAQPAQVLASLLPSQHLGETFSFLPTLLLPHNLLSHALEEGGAVGNIHEMSAHPKPDTMRHTRNML